MTIGSFSATYCKKKKQQQKTTKNKTFDDIKGISGKGPVLEVP